MRVCVLWTLIDLQTGSFPLDKTVLRAHQVMGQLTYIQQGHEAAIVVPCCFSTSVRYYGTRSVSGACSGTQS